MAPLAAVAALAAACSPLCLAQSTPQQVYASHQSELALPGVREFDGYTLAVQLLPSDRAAEQSGPGALRRMLEYRIEQVADWRIASDTVRRAALTVATGCVGGAIDVAGLVRVARERQPDGSVRTVHALPAAKLQGVRVSMEQLIECVRRRVETDSPGMLEALLLSELQGDAVTDAQFIGWLSTACGDGIQATASGRWTRADGRPMQQGLESWASGIGAAATRGTSLAVAANPLSSAAVDQIDDPGRCLAMLGRRANDAALLARARELLASQGWPRSAARLPQAAATCGGCVDPGTSRMPREARARLASSTTFTLLLVTDGAFPLTLAPQPGASFEQARSEFNAATPESIERAAVLLGSSFVSSPDLPSAVLLAAALLALDDPALAYPVAAAAFRTDPAHPYAGVNMLRAARALGRAQDARRLLPEVERQAKLDAWGDEELERIRRWLAE